MLGGKGKINVFECGRRDPNTPCEATLVTLELVNEGMIGRVALSEVRGNADRTTVRAAAQITNIVAVQVDALLFCREPLSEGLAKAWT